MDQTPTGPAPDSAATGAQPPESPPGQTSPPSGDSAQPQGSPAPDGAQPPQAAEPPKKPADSPVQRRIDELVRARHEAERIAATEAAKRQRLEMEQQAASQIRELDAQEPKPEAYGSLLEYQRAVADWSTRKALAVFDARAALQQHETTLTQRQQEMQAQELARALQAEQVRINAKMSAGKTKYADFEKSVNDPNLPSMLGTPLHEALMSADHAHDIAYSLAKNPAEYSRLLALSVQNPVAAFKEVASLDVKFSAASKTTGAPPPPPNLGGSAPLGDKPSVADTEAWMKWREADLKAKRQRA